MGALLTGETIKMIDVRLGSHDHFECWYLFVTCRARSRAPKDPEVVPLAEDKISFEVEGRADLS